MSEPRTADSAGQIAAMNAAPNESRVQGKTPGQASD